jgi:class 3 adenylate cyclase
MREMHRELIGLRALLAEEINSSLCIMGPARSAGGAGIPESSALLANTLLTGHCVTPAESRTIMIFSFAAAFLALLCIHTLGPVLLLLLGILSSLLCGAAFGVYFIINAYWIDPFVSMAACMGGTLFLTLTRFCISYGRKLRFRLAYAGSVNSVTLKRLIRKGRPLLGETLCSHAVIIAVKNSGMSGREDRETALEAAETAAEFRQKFSRIFKRRGALVLGFENDTGFACFGSPPERVCGEEILHPAVRAVSCIRKIMNDPVSEEWRFGLESGECAFSWSSETGYTAKGRPVVRARIFASLASRYQARVIIGESAREDSNVPVKKLASLSGECFYELPGSERN